MELLKTEFDKALIKFESKNEEDREEAAIIFKELGESDDSLGEIYSKSYYYLGKHFERLKDYETARKYYNRSIKGDSNKTFAPAFRELGRFYYFKYGVEADYEKAYNYFCNALSAPNGSDVQSYYFKGLCHKYKKIENPSEKVAFECFVKANEVYPSRLSALELSRCYQQGIGTKIDLTKALELVQKYKKVSSHLIQTANILIDLKDFKKAKETLNIIKPEDEKYNSAISLIESINNSFEPNAVLEAVKQTGNDFSELEKIISEFSPNGEIIYDLALKAEKENDIILAVKLFVISAAAGCKKAGYTLSNMAAENTKYFTEIVEYGAN